MKKFIVFGLTSIMSLTLFLPIASAQLLVNTSADQGIASMTESVRKTANFSTNSIENIIAGVIQIILGFLAITFIILMIVAGFRWMTAQGNEEMITEAQGTIRNAIIGLVVVLLAYAITYFVFKYVPFSGGTGVQTVTSG